MSKVNKPMNNISFKMMSAFFAVRDKFSDPMKKIKKAKINLGDHVLDYGAGPGAYSIAAAKVVGELGKIYSVDIQPLSSEVIRKKASKIGLRNIKTITSNCDTGLENNSIDVVLCLDMFHMIKNQDELLKEFYRVLKDKSILSFDCHHMKEDIILSKITDSGLFKLVEKIDDTYNFIKNI